MSERIAHRRWFFFRDLILLTVVSLALFAGSAARADDMTTRRVALVIGVGKYVSPTVPMLQSAATDARIISNALKSVGFDVIVLIDPSGAALQASLSAFRQKAAGADIALVYYSGHGGEIDGRDYMFGTDVSGESAEEVKRSSVDLQEAYDVASSAHTLGITVFDAGRTSLFTSSARGARVRGFQLGTPTGVSQSEALTIFAASRGGYAYDNIDSSTNGSMFSRAFAARITEPGDILRVVGRVGEDVRISSLGGQRPTLEVTGMRGKPICLIRCDDSAIPSNASALAQAEAPHCEGEWTLPPGGREARYALVIGEIAYHSDRFEPLPSTRTDARNIEEGLSATGFSVVTCFNLDSKSFLERTKMLSTVLKISADSRSKSVPATTTGFLYYSGHGAASDHNNNYLIPIGVNPVSSTTLADSGIAVHDVAVSLLESGADSIFVIADACRNALTDSGTKAVRQVGLVSEGAPDGAFIAFSAEPGKAAFDDAIYSSVLRDALKKRPGTDARVVFSQVRLEVRRRTHDQQIPFNVDNLKIDQFLFQLPASDRPR